jgi:hypothetical protein
MNVLGAIVAGLAATAVMTGVMYIAPLTMPMMLRMHPRPPEMSFGVTMIMGVLMAHLIYGLVVALVYAVL